MPSHLLFDMSGIAYKYFFAISKGDSDFLEPLINFKFLSVAHYLQDLFCARNVYFLFDHRSIRCDHYPDYKKGRSSTRGRGEDKKELLQRFQDNMKFLRRSLKEMGFKNTWRRDGYEADDLIAALVKFVIPKNEQKIIVSGDHDLHQLITHNCIVYDIRKNVTVSKSTIIKKYGINPKKLNVVKAMSGDKSDNIKGIDGIGETRALAYVKRELQERSTYLKLIEGQTELIERNLELVTLPYRKLNYDFLKIKEDTATFKKWESFCLGNKVYRNLLQTRLRGNNNG